MESLERIIKTLPFFEGLAPEYIELITGCASNTKFEAGSFIFHSGGEAHQFHIIRHGQLALELHTADRGTFTIDTLSEGDVLGYSWLFPPNRWHFDAHCLSLVRCLTFDASCLLKKLESDPAFGYQMMRRFSTVILRRLQATRLQLLDVYQSPKK